MAYEVGVVADLDLKKFDDGVRDFERQVDKVESALDGLEQTFNDIERAANQADIDIKPDVDTSDVQRAEASLDDLLDVLNRIDRNTASPDVEPQGTQEAEDKLEGIQSTLDEIALFERFEFVWNFITNLGEITEQLENIPGLGSLMQLERAGAQFAAQTGQDRDAVDDLIRSLYTGENAIIGTREEIAQMAATTYQATQNFETLDEDVRAVNNIAEAFGQDFNEVLATANQLVQTGLAPNIQAATDLIAAGFQSGANRGGDLLDVLNEYASTFAEAGMTGGEVLGAINAGLDAGSGNADRAADAIRELGIRTATAGDSANGFDQAFEDAAIAAGVLDEAIAFRSGTLSGDAYLTAISEGLNSIADEGERAAAAAGLFGTQAEDLGSGFAGALGTGDDFDNIEGRAEEAADTIRDTLSTTLQEFSQEIDQAFVEILDAANVDEWIENARGKLETFLDELRGGRSIGEALEIALEIPGLADTLLQVQVVLQEVGIGLLQGIQALLSVVGRGDLASGMSGTIESLGAGQLGFAASVAQESNDIADAVASATSRGLSRAEIGEIIEEQLQTAIASGDLEAAQAILGAAEGGELFGLSTSITDYEGQIATLATGIRDQFDAAIMSGDFASAGLLADDLGTNLQAELERAVSEGNFDVAALIAQRLDEQEGTSRLLSVIGEAAAAGLSEEQINTILENAQAASDGTMTMAEEVALSADEVTTTLQDAEVSFDEFSATVQDRSQLADSAFSQFADNVGYKAAEAAGALQRLQDEYAELVTAFGGQIPGDGEGGTPEDPGTGRGFAAGGVGHGTFMVHEDELVSTNTPLAILNEQTTDSILSGLAALFAGGFSGGGSTTITNNNTISIVMNNSGAAAGTASGNRISDMVRGYGG